MKAFVVRLPKVHFRVICLEERPFEGQEPDLRGKKEFEQTVFFLFFDELET